MKKNIIIFLLGGLFFGMIGVGATLLYTAKDIEFIPNNTNWKVTSVDDAINDLYDNQVKVIYLGTGTSFDVKSKLPEGFDYSRLTNANFVVEATSKPSTTIGGYSNGGGSSDFEFTGYQYDKGKHI